MWWLQHPGRESRPRGHSGGGVQPPGEAVHGAVAAVAEHDAAEEEQALAVRQGRPAPHFLGLGTPRLVQALVRGPTPATAVPRRPAPPLRSRS